MDYIFCVQVLNSEANVYEYLPDQVVNEWFDNLALTQLLLPLNHGIQVANGAVLKNQIDFLVFYKRIDISYNIRVFKHTHYLYLV